MGGLLTLYTAASVFGIGVTLLDLLGIFGHGGHGGDGAAAHDAASGHDGAGTHVLPSSVLGHQPPQKKLAGLRALTFLRTAVYFCFGFGPLGWISYSTSASVLKSLLWSIPTGIVFAAAGLVVRRIQRTTLDSQVTDGELLMEEAEVIVPIEPGSIGKVRVPSLSVERFARARDAAVSYAVGEKVRVVSLADDLLIVSHE